MSDWEESAGGEGIYWVGEKRHLESKHKPAAHSMVDLHYVVRAVKFPVRMEFVPFF